MLHNCCMVMQFKHRLIWEVCIARSQDFTNAEIMSSWSHFFLLLSLFYIFYYMAYNFYFPTWRAICCFKDFSTVSGMLAFKCGLKKYWNQHIKYPPSVYTGHDLCVHNGRPQSQTSDKEVPTNWKCQKCFCNMVSLI